MQLPLKLPGDAGQLAFAIHCEPWRGELA